jgi:hypothetical protein
LHWGGFSAVLGLTTVGSRWILWLSRRPQFYSGGTVEWLLEFETC